MNYVPPPPPQQFPSASGRMYAPAPPSGKPKGGVVWIVISGVIATLLLVVCFVAGIFVIVFRSMKSSEPYQHALQAATHDPRVVERLGAPLTPGWFTTGSMSVSGSSGDADLTIPLSGSKGQGAIYVRAKKSEGEWTYDNLAFRVKDGGERIDLLHPPDSGSKEK
jgi:Cytochrome oxidase complex assembly protein 1